MAKINIPHLVIKTMKNGHTYCYWQPSLTLRQAGWQMLVLGSDLRAAQRAAEAQNDKVEEWRTGGAKPRQVKKFVARGTVGQMITRYEAEHLPTLGTKTQKTYLVSLRILRRWADDEMLAHITRDRARRLKKSLLKPDATGYVAENRAAAAMRVARSLWQWAIDEAEPRLLPEGHLNPFADQNMPTPAPRDQIWSPAAVDLFVAAALEAGQPSLALAIHLGREVAQREGDLLGLTLSKVTSIPRHKVDPADWERLAEPGPDGTMEIRALRVRQGKTMRWVEIPVVGETRQLLDTAIAEARADRSLVLLREVREMDDAKEMPSEARTTTMRMPWTETRFQRAIAALRLAAADMARVQGDEELATEIEGLQFRDLRRTAVVWLGELGIEDHLIAAITGHQLDSTRKILEVYMPRTTKMAGKAIALRMERDPATPAKGRQAKEEEA